MNKKTTRILSVFAINLLMFAVFFSFFYPVYDSKEDVYAAYMLSGGFGNAPTDYLHYNYGLHPFLNSLIKNLFLFSHKINWYSIALLTGNFVSSCVLLWLMIRRSFRWMYLLVYFALFLVFDGYFLMTPNFTNTSILLTCAGMSYSMVISRENGWRVRHVIIVILLLVLASFFRIHSMFLIVILALPFLVWAGNWITKLKTAGILLAAALSVLLFNKLHESYYAAKDPGWTQEETNRNKIYLLHNYHSATFSQVHPGEKWYMECQFLTRFFICDSSMFSAKRIDSLYNYLVSVKTPPQKTSAAWRKWFFINNFQFFCLFAFVIFFFGTIKRLRAPLLLSLLSLIALCWYLLDLGKLPYYIFTGCLYIQCLALVSGNEVNPSVLKYRYGRAIIVLIFSLFICWGLIRQYKTSQRNIGNIGLFKGVRKEMIARPGTLFIITNNFPINYFYVFDSPTDYPMENYIDTEHFLLNLYYPVLNRFHLSGFRDIPAADNVLFWGTSFDELSDYFEKITGRKVEVSPPLPAFHYGEVRQYRFKPE